jgi:hypothetical protein
MFEKNKKRYDSTYIYKHDEIINRKKAWVTLTVGCCQLERKIKDKLRDKLMKDKFCSKYS